MNYYNRQFLLQNTWKEFLDIWGKTRSRFSSRQLVTFLVTLPVDEMWQSKWLKPWRFPELHIFLQTVESSSICNIYFTLVGGGSIVILTSIVNWCNFVNASIQGQAMARTWNSPITVLFVTFKKAYEGRNEPVHMSRQL